MFSIYGVLIVAIIAIAVVIVLWRMCPEVVEGEVSSGSMKSEFKARARNGQPKAE